MPIIIFRHMLTSPYCCTKYIWILAIIVTELELINIERKILATNFMERPDNAALHQRPESLYGVRVNVAMHVFAFTVMYHAMREVLVQIPDVV